MKNFIILLNVALILWVTSIFSTEHSSENVEANKENLLSPRAQLASEIEVKVKKTNSHPYLSKANPISASNVSDFILEASETRIMDMEQGKIAQQRATTRALKDYSTMMVNDQSRMLEELKKIAGEKKLDISTTPGESKADELTDLKEIHGKDFDDKFITMMILDHKRDIKKFENALSSTDPDIQVFATKYLPLVKAHLDKIKSIKKGS